jgi:O-6-methylguanine DNA methyltransferase
VSAALKRLPSSHENIAGKQRAAVGLDLAFDVRGTPFQRRVWTVLLGVPAGSTITYAALASRIGKRDAVRAVARACAANAIALGIPCHRVMRSDGTLSGYRWGVARKRALLAREGAVHRDVLKIPASIVQGAEARVTGVTGTRSPLNRMSKAARPD